MFLRLTAVVPLCALALIVAGCHPRSPLPDRHGDETQQKFDAVWNRAFTPADKLNRQDLLDVLVGLDAIREGVDVFAMRAEKRLADGKVVLLLAFDRAKPDDDRFEVTVFDAAGVAVRHERYTRDEMEEATRALHQVPRQADGVRDNPGMAAERANYDARWKKITDLFPKE
jgi:hypothetical protein